MKHRPALVVLLAVVAVTLAATQSAYSGNGKTNKHEEAVFVQTNEPAGNRIVVYDRGHDGRLTPAGSYPTGGLGGVALPGAESDHLASQGSLVYDRHEHVLLAVNAASDTVSLFSVDGDVLHLEDVVPSGGQFPASIAVHKKLVYVLNAGATGIIQGFTLDKHGLEPIAGSARSLGLANSDPPNFLTSPGQVGFTPGGQELIVTTKASGSMIDVFQVDHDGMLSAMPVHNVSATPVPFAFTFTKNHRLASGEAGASSVTTYEIEHNGTLSDPKSETDGQVALCWIQRVGRYYYVSNTGSNNISAYEIAANGQPSLVGGTGIVATTAPGPIDLTSPHGTRFLYAQTGSGTVHEFAVNHDGTLTALGVITGLPPGMEGIASS